MANKKTICSVSLLESVIAKADEAVDNHPEEYPNRSRFFELAGIQLYRAMKRKEQR